MVLRGMLLSCLAHLLLAWVVWQNGWMNVAAVQPSIEAPEAVLMAVFQPLEPGIQASTKTPPLVAAAVSEQARPKEAAASEQAPVPASVPVPSPAVVSAPTLEPSARHVQVPQKKPMVRAEPAATRKPATATRSQEVTAAVAGTAAVSATPPIQSPATAAPQAAPIEHMPPAPRRPSYAQRLTHRIEQYKRYPRRARERGLSGEVRFSVNVDDAGEMLAFHWLEGHQVFRRSTLQAVRRALPYPPDPGQAPISIQIRMIYSLQDRI